MDNNRLSILDLNEDCQREIMKYIIADCEMRDISQNKMKYADLINFALAHENLEAILEEYFKKLYKSLEFVFVVNRRHLEIDFSELETTHTGKEGEAFWRLYANAIRQNNVVDGVILKYDSESFHPNFVDHFELIKRALEHKKRIYAVTIKLKGYSLEDLNNFGHITHLHLDVRMNAEALVEVCKSNPHLKTLYFRSTEILGRLSDIAPHCPNLTYLTFAPKPDIDGVEYAPLAQLPKLREMDLYGAHENGSVLIIFEAIRKWKRPGLQALHISFSEYLPHLSSVNIARANSFLKLNLRHDDEAGIHLIASYDFWDISRDNSPLEHSLATIPLIAAELDIDYKQLTLYECPKSDTDINGFYSILKLFNIKSLNLSVKEEEIAKLIALIISDKSLDLKSINIYPTIDQSVTSELVKIKSITSLDYDFSDWESVDLLSALTNLETVRVKVVKGFESMTTSKAFCSLINTCSASGVIKYFNGDIEFKKIESIKSQSKRSTALKMYAKGEALSHIFEAFSYTDLMTIEELDVLKCLRIKIKDILKMAEVHPIKKLKISLADTNDIEHFSDLAELGALEELTIHDSIKGSLTELFKQMKASPSLQSLKIHSKELSSEELVQVSKISALKKLDLCDSEPEDCESLMDLANTDIEELTLATQQFSLQQLFSAFAKKSTSKLQHLKLESNDDEITFELQFEKPYRYLEICELEEIAKIKSLKSLRIAYLHNDVSFLRNFKHLVKLDFAVFEKNLEELKCLAELKTFESLTLRLRKYSLPQNYDILADIQNLKELNLLVSGGVNVNLTNVYKAIVRKNVKLTHLTTLIRCVGELNEITQIKTLRKLRLFFLLTDTQLPCLGELSELESLQITFLDSFEIDVLPILRCCRNLDRLLINSDYCLSQIYTHLKSIRDPTLQGPLTVILAEDETIHKIFEWYHIPGSMFWEDALYLNEFETLSQVVRFENVYMKVMTILFN